MSKFKLYFMLILLVQTFVCFCVSSMDRDEMISEINKRIKILEQKTTIHELQEFSVEHFTYLESGPCQIQIIYEGKRVRIVYLLIPHETWMNKFCYYFDKNESIMKFLKITLYRDNITPREAIFYNEKGEIIWGNTNDIPMSPKDLKDKIKQLFNALNSIEKAHSKF